MFHFVGGGIVILPCKSQYKQGKYIGKDLSNWRGNEQAIGQTFSEILANYDIDPTGACIEVYTGEDVRCMVRLRD